MARFTIGIPTYNRADYLKRSIPTALEQTADDVEIVVCDNASTDNTAEVVASFGERVRYHRNPTNLGATGNFERALELATGTHFSWLQDDDLIHRDFVRRARDGFALGGDVAAYACFSVSTPSPTTFYHSFLTGPAVPLGWMQGGMTVLDGILVAPVSLFYSFGNPPALAYRTEELRAAVRTPHRCVLFDERILLAATVAAGRVAVDPWPGAVFSDHADQDYKRIFREDPESRITQWYTLADAMAALLDRHGDGWKAATRSFFGELPLIYRLRWLQTYTPRADAWLQANPTAREIWTMLVATLPAELQPQFLNPPRSWAPQGRAKALIKDLMPPLIWNAVRNRAARR